MELEITTAREFEPPQIQLATPKPEVLGPIVVGRVGVVIATRGEVMLTSHRLVH